MKLMLVYDTETTGLPQWGLPSEDPSQPHITQLAAELCDEHNGNVLTSMDVLIKPDGWIIPPDVAELTGITTERALDEGVPLSDALEKFTDMWRQVSLRVGHHERFDARMLRIEYFRNMSRDDTFHEKWKEGLAFCTQAKSTKIVNQSRAGKKKTASLAEAYEFFTGEKLEGAHNAAVDLMACKEVYYGIKRHEAKAAA